MADEHWEVTAQDQSEVRENSQSPCLSLEELDEQNVSLLRLSLTLKTWRVSRVTCSGCGTCLQAQHSAGRGRSAVSSWLSRVIQTRLFSRQKRKRQASSDGSLESGASQIIFLWLCFGFQSIYRIHLCSYMSLRNAMDCQKHLITQMLRQAGLCVYGVYKNEIHVSFIL